MKKKQKVKQKTHKGAARRFSITGTGMVMRRAVKRHRKAHASDSNVRRRKIPREVEGEFGRKIKRLLALQ